MKRSDLKTSLFLAGKNLSKTKKTTVIIVGVLAASFLSITFFAAIIDGLSYEFEDSMIERLTGHLSIEPGKKDRFIENSDVMLKNLNRISGILGAERRLTSSSVVSKKDTQIGSSLIFIEPEKCLEVSNFKNSVILGEYLSTKNENEILIGAGLVEKFAKEDSSRERLDVDIGETVILGFSNGHTEEYKIKGIYQTGSRFVDEYILINYGEYSDIFGTENEVAEQILIKLKGRGLENEYIKKIRNIGIGEEIHPWQSKMGMVKEFTGSLQITNQITTIIGLMTAFATVYIIIFINVNNKRKQIGILKAVGIKRRIILSSYMFQSLTYGIGGVILGNVLMSILLYILTINPLTMPIGKVIPLLSQERRVYTSLMLILASVVAGFFPSFKAAKDNILDAIFGG